MATNYPLLIFPTPVSTDRITRKIGFTSSNIHKPSIDRQMQRMSPQFAALVYAFERQHAELQSSTEGIDPEQVLVFETVGSVDNFITAVKRIEGFEWMAEVDVDDIAPSDDFRHVDEPESSLSGKLYLTMTNQNALNQMLSIWNHYSTDPNYRFATGTTAFRDLFANLKTIRRWDVQDRLFETGIMQVWQENLAMGASSEKIEIQLWYHNSEEKRTAAQANISGMIQEVGGSIISFSIIPEIAYHAILADIPTTEIYNIISTPTTKLVRNHYIMFFRPTGQMAINVGEEDDVLVDEHEMETERPLPAGEPIIALLDGLPLENHRVLANRLIVDDPDNFSDNYEAAFRRHGTAMSSLIINGDLKAGDAPISTPLYVRPIMKLKIGFIDREERVPEDILFTDLIHRSVRRIFEGDADTNPIPSIKVINLSIGDPSLQYFNSMSPVARLLDWLSFKYKVLFIISAGNHCGEINLRESYRDFKTLSSRQKEESIYTKVISDQRNRRLLSPSESINNVTVGSVHFDHSGYSNVHDLRIEPTNHLMPNIHSAFGFGYRNSIKPDFVYFGGRQLLKEPFSEIQPARFEYFTQFGAPGNCVARPDITLSSDTYFSRGTSDATALTTRNAAKINDVLKEIFQDHYNHPSFSQYMSLLTKSLLAHGCSWSEIESNLLSILRGTYTNKEIKTIITKWIGYGLPDFNKVIECTERRVTVLGFGELNKDKSHLYRLPLPPSLSSEYGQRKLTVTLSWFSPIAAKTQKYRSAKLFFKTNSKLEIARDDADWQKVMKGTLQHEIFEGVNAVAFDEDENVEITVTCMADAEKHLTSAIPYALAVTLEVADGLELPIYQEVRDKLITPITIDSMQ